MQPAEQRRYRRRRPLDPHLDSPARQIANPSVQAQIARFFAGTPAKRDALDSARNEDVSSSSGSVSWLVHQLVASNIVPYSNSFNRYSRLKHKSTRRMSKTKSRSYLTPREVAQMLMVSPVTFDHDLYLQHRHRAA